MTKDKALTMALDFIERVNKDGWLLADFEPEMYAAITAIKEALAQPEQEPVAWEQFYPDIGKPKIAINPKTVGYVAPQRKWVGLTLDDIPDDDTNNLDFYRGCRWAERVLKEKNT